MPSSAPDPLLLQLGSHRWLVPLLADLAAHRGARFVELLHRLTLSRDSLTRTLNAAAAQGWVQRNPGHGHPLRPEYILTEAGKAAAARAATIAAAQGAIGLPSGMTTRWTLPLVAGIGAGHYRFNACPRDSARAVAGTFGAGRAGVGSARGDRYAAADKSLWADAEWRDTRGRVYNLDFSLTLPTGFAGGPLPSPVGRGREARSAGRVRAIGAASATPPSQNPPHARRS
jgi:DNA-binding HxlR family transcriptional regulator